MNISNLVKTILLALAAVLLMGIATRAEHFWGNDQLIVLGAAFMLIHAAFNTDMILAPFKYADQKITRYGFTRTFGILFIVLGVIELTSVASTAPAFH